MKLRYFNTFLKFRLLFHEPHCSTFTFHTGRVFTSAYNAGSNQNNQTNKPTLENKRASHTFQLNHHGRRGRWRDRLH